MSRMTKQLTLFACLSLIAAACGGGADLPTAPSNSSSPSTTAASGTGATTYTYTADVRPILTADCTRCHNASQHEAGYDFTTYAGVRRALTPGSASSQLVRQTQPGGGMYGELSGNRAEKAGIIRDWVVSSRAAE